METDSQQSSLANSAASTPSPSAHPDSNPWEVDRDIAEHEERQPTTGASSKIQVAAQPALDSQALLGKNQEQQPTRPTQLSIEVAGHYVKKCWNMIKNIIVYLLLLLLVVFGVVLAFSLSRSPATELSHVAEPCSNAEWIYYRKSCYYHNPNRTDWNSSQNFCAQYGATLALMHKEEDLDSIAKVCTIDCWIGLHKTGGEFQWADGTPYDSSLFKVQGRGECAYVKSKTVYATDCKLPRPSICMMKPYKETRDPR